MRHASANEETFIVHSIDRILTTHTGSLPRPEDLVKSLIDRDAGKRVDPASLESRVSDAVAYIIGRQVDAGIDVVNDGEQGKSSYLNYLRDRVGGLELMGDTGPFITLEHVAYAVDALRQIACAHVSL